MESLLTPYAASGVPDAPAVLVLAPHPDDEVFGCGGAIALHVAAGHRVHVVVLTGGQEAGDAKVRADESRAAAVLLGCEPPVFWNLPDRGLVYGEALVVSIVETLAAHGATILYAPSLWENHPDHRALALAALEAARRSTDCAIMCYEVSAPLRPNWLIDITSVLAQKRAAMQCFGSQLTLQRYDRHIEALNVFRSYTLPHAVQAAEAYEHYDAATLGAAKLPFLDSEYRRQQARGLMAEGLMALPEEQPLVSVLIRSMDRAELRKALDSVAAQTWPRVEVVVVSAKGPGHSPLPEWCGRFPMRLIQSAVPLHRSAAANLAIDYAQGATLLLLDDDDWLDADHLHKLSSALRARPDAVAAVTGTRGVDLSGQKTHEWKEPSLQRLMLVNQMPIMSVLFRRPAALAGSNELPRFDVTLDLFEDWDFWLQVHQLGAFVKVAGVSATYLIRTLGGSGVHDAQASLRGQARVRDKWRGRWPDAWLDALRVELDGGDRKLGVKEAERAELDQALQQAEQVRSLLQGALDNLAQQLDALRDQRAEEIKAQEHRYLRLTGEKDLLVQRVEAQDLEHSLTLERHALVWQDKGKALAASKRQGNDLTHQLLLARQTIDAQARQLDQSERARSGTALQVQALFSSRSWRVTAPVRYMAERLRALRGG